MLPEAAPYETRRFTAREVLRMVEVGLLAEDEKVELLEGELVVVTPQGPVHSALAAKIRRLLEHLYGDGYHERDHSPVMGLPDSMPEPDVAVVSGEPDDYYDALPSSEDVRLVVEIAVTSGAVDRRKARVYAAAGYQAYWILDVAARRLEVRSGPTGDGDWAETKLLEESAEATAPGTAERVTVRLLLP
jgi:Uma2 family endonuclease